LKNNMRLASIVFLILLFSACKKLTEFTFSDSCNFEVQSSSPISTPFSVPSPSVTSNSQTSFASNNTDASHIQSITLQQLSLTITSPSGQNFDFLSSIQISISAPGLSTQQIASLSSVPKGVTTIQLNSTGLDLTSYAKQSSYTLGVTVVTDQVVTQNIYIQANTVFYVKAKIL